jgi:hypothetical protein
LKLDKYKVPITRSKSKQLFILRSKNHIPGISPDMEEINEQLQEEAHEDRQGGGRDSARNQESLRFENQRIIKDSPLNILGEQHDLLVLPKGTLKEFSRDKAIDAKRHLHLFLDVCDFHHVEYGDVMVRLFIQTLSRRAYE